VSADSQIEEVLTMTRPGSRSKHMIVTVETATGKVVKVADERGRKATKVSARKLQQISKSRSGFRYVATILHSHSSPGCVYYVYLGSAFAICS
jgi:hypothetical protein